MLVLHSRLPQDRYTEGQIWLEEDGRRIFGPFRCRGEADNANAEHALNAVEDPALPGGDHPYGRYQIMALIKVPPTSSAYGPWFFRLEPLEGEALLAKEDGRTGMGIHGGALHADGRLRETFGCLRVDDRTMNSLAVLLHEPMTRREVIEYQCEPL